MINAACTPDALEIHHEAVAVLCAGKGHSLSHLTGTTSGIATYESMDALLAAYILRLYRQGESAAPGVKR